MIGQITRLEDVLGLLLTVVPIDEGDVALLDVLASWRAAIGLWSDAERAAASDWALMVRKGRAARTMPVNVAALPYRGGPAVGELLARVIERERVATYLEAGAVSEPRCAGARSATTLGRAIRRGDHDLVVDALEILMALALREQIAVALGYAPDRVEVRVERQLFSTGRAIGVKIDGGEPTPREGAIVHAVTSETFEAHGVVTKEPPRRRSS